MSNNDKILEERLLRKEEIEERMRQDAFELAQIRELEVKTVKKKVIEKDFSKLNFVAVGNDLASSDVFSKNAVYDYLNEETGIITPFNGLQAQGVFGTNDSAMTAFGMKQLGAVYRIPEKFTLKFRHFEIN
jgi:hypothetical protein